MPPEAKYKAGLHILRGRNRATSEVLTHLGQAVSRVLSAEVELLTEDADTVVVPGDGIPFTIEFSVEDFADWRDGNVLTDTLIGAGFVVCQTDITQVVNLIMTLDGHAKKDGKPLQTTTLVGKAKVDKATIMRWRRPTIGKGSYTDIEVIDAVANFYKHRAEWANRMNCHAEETTRRIESIGLDTYGCSDLRIALEAFGLQPDGLRGLDSRLETWRTALHAAYEAEVRGAGLIPR